MPPTRCWPMPGNRSRLSAHRILLVRLTSGTHIGDKSLGQQVWALGQRSGAMVWRLENDLHGHQ